MCINAFVVFHVGEMLKISMSENASSIKILLFFLCVHVKSCVIMFTYRSVMQCSTAFVCLLR